MTDDQDDDDVRWVCADCIGEDYLSDQVRTWEAEQVCAFCDGAGPAITVEALSGWVETAFEAHYYRTSNEPDALQSMMLRDKQSDYEFERPGDDVLWAIWTTSRRRSLMSRATRVSRPER